MKLDAAQKQTVAGWIADGMKLADIQKRIGTEFGISLTYMDVRFLVDDLKLLPKDPEPPKPVELPKPATPAGPEAAADTAAPEVPDGAPLPEAAPAGVEGKVSVTVDQIARPGAMVSGKVTFSDGQSATWYLDQMGRLGLAPAQKGYKPSTPDVQEFQIALQVELQRMGF